jgi:iron complex outermembrane recepter protein
MNLKLISLLLTLFIVNPGFAQVVISGKVVDKETNKPVVGANVMVTNTTKGTLTDNNGVFHIQPDGDLQSITISFVGYKTTTIKNPVKGLTVSLVPVAAELTEVIVKGVYTKPVKRTSDEIYTGSALTENGLKLMGGAAVNSVYNAIDLMPGVSVESYDAYGLSDKSVRIRCVKDNFSGMTMEGFPNYGIMPIGARDDIYDIENIHQIALFKGATPSDLGTATGSKGGAIELQFKRPSEEFGAQINQSLGMNNYTRSFARIDMGRLSTGTSVFISYSFTRSDKWKGPGKLGPRNNMAIGITQAISPKATLEIFANYNQINRHDFRPLTYGEAMEFENDYDLSFNSSLTGNPSDDIYYYDYNGGNFINRDLMSTFTYALFDNQKIIFKYYLSSEDAAFNEGVQKGENYFVFDRKREINRMGIIPEISGKFVDVKYSAGCWIETSDNNANVYSSRLTATGLQPVGYSSYSVNQGNGSVYSPYAKVAYSIKKFSFQAGLKYFYYKDPESERYTSETPAELMDVPDPDLHTNEMLHNALLPTAGIGFKFNSKLEAYVNYGKNYMRPYMYSPVISLYVKNQQTFTDNGMTLQDVFDKWEMETSDNFDFGLRFNDNHITVSPSVFYAKHHHVLASAYDPVIELDYYRNVGELTAYGTELECYIFPVEKLMLYVNPAYNIMRYDEELYRSSESLDVKGKLAPASPKLVFKTGAVYSFKNIDFAGKVKYIGTRYGDATNIEEIPGYTLVDASVKYTMKNLWKVKALSMGLELKNIFNKHYIGGIDVSDDSTQGSASYYAGAPFTAMGSLNLKF